MVSTKALAAIALTLIIAMPVGIGFLTAVHQEETDSWQTTSSSKISDLMLNHQTPYFGSYKGSSNNAVLLGEDSASPQYVSTTSTFSSLPTYTETSHAVTTAASYNYISGSATADTAVMPISGYVPGYTNAVIGSHDIYQIRTSHMSVEYSMGGGNTAIATLSNPDLEQWTFWIYRSSASTWAVYKEESPTPVLMRTDIINWFAATDYENGHQVGCRYADYETVDSSLVPATISAIHASVNFGDNYIMGNHNIALTSSAVIVDGVEYEINSSTAVKIASVSTTNATTSVATGNYADPANGWTVPDTSDSYLWVNNQKNQTVTFYLKADVAAGQYATIGGLRIFVDNQQVGAYLIDEGIGSTQMLGKYSYLQVVVSTTGYTITGIASWPSMGTVPQTYNTLTFNTAREVFYSVDIQATSTNWHFRVDNANIEQGTYPSTYDYSLNLQQIYPDTNIDIYLNSIGIYGDYINFGGAQLTVDNGSVSINGKTYRLLHAHLSAWNEGTHYSLRINGDEVATTSEPPTIFWGGEWSVTATAYKIEQVHEYVTVWHAGEFGLDKTGFAVAGLLACGALLVVLGLSGQRSGGKMGVLLLICGGAAIVFLLII